LSNTATTIIVKSREIGGARFLEVDSDHPVEPTSHRFFSDAR
jgi:hypothetical protein